MLFAGRRLEPLRSLPRGRLSLQISLDSPTPARHDRPSLGPAHGRAHGEASSVLAPKGFRVRLAATVSSDDEAEEFRRFLDARQIEDEDRVIRQIALRGFATQGIALARADLVPEITITAGRRLLASGRRGGRRLAGHFGDFFRLPHPLLRCGRAFEHESEHQPPIGADLQLRLTGERKKGAAPTAFQAPAGGLKNPCCAAASRSEP